MIIRRRVIRKEKPSRGYDFLVLYDGSEESKKALTECLRLVDIEKDTVDCVTFDSLNTMENHRPNIENLFKEAKLSHCSYKVISIMNENTREAIEKYLNNEDTPDYDFVVLGSEGEGKKKKTQVNHLGTVAEKVILIGRTNLILTAK